jgi:hypothetical protein
MTTTTIDIAGLDGGHVNLTPAQLDELDSRIAGRLLRAGDEGWDDALLVWNAMAANVPALVLQPTSARDVAAAVGFARDHGLLLGVKGGGHNIAGTAIAEGGLTLDLSRSATSPSTPTPSSPRSGLAVCSRTSTRPPKPMGWPRRWGSSPRSAWPG